MEEMSPRRSLGNGLSPSFASKRTDPWLPAASAGKDGSWDVGYVSRVMFHPSLSLSLSLLLMKIIENRSSNEIFIVTSASGISVTKRGKGKSMVGEGFV